ncbi:MAG: hypothetical protein NZ656_05180 [Nitrospinaceae bacterium]|nr:hypothetical protein [Nitrospinaceae bacterium]
MAYSRYGRTAIFLNKDKNYKNVFFRRRGIEETFQYEFPRLSYPSNEFMADLTNITEVWKSTDKLYNVSNKHYGSPEYWWVIAWYNKKASEAEFKTGDVYYIPLPLDDVLGLF